MAYEYLVTVRETREVKVLIRATDGLDVRDSAEKFLEDGCFDFSSGRIAGCNVVEAVSSKKFPDESAALRNEGRVYYTRAAKKERSGEPLKHGRREQHLIEITRRFSALTAERPELAACGISPEDWNSAFVDWANRFERDHMDLNWDGTDGNYHEEIGKFADGKILELAGLSGHDDAAE